MKECQKRIAGDGLGVEKTGMGAPPFTAGCALPVLYLGVSSEFLT